MELKELMDYEERHVRKVIGRGENCSPKVLAAIGDVLMVSFLKVEDPMGAAKLVIGVQQPDIYVYSSEGWVATPPPGVSLEEFKKTYRRGMARDAKDRIEVLMIIGRTRDGKAEDRRFTIDRINNKLPLIFPVDPGARLVIETRLPATW